MSSRNTTSEFEQGKPPASAVGSVWWTPRWWWFTLALCILVHGNWLFFEAATLYGDEDAHMRMAYGVGEAWATGGTVGESVSAAYQGGNGRYPPLGHGAMLVLAELGSNPLVAARLASAIAVTIGVLAFAVSAVRATGRRRNGIIASVLLVGCSLTTQAGRYAYLEGYLILWMGLLSLAFVMYIARPSFRWWVAASVIVGLGLMSKFNFLMYTAPMLLAIVFFELIRWRRSETVLWAVLARLLLAGVLVAGIAGPWYVMNARDPANAGSGLQNLIDAGHLRRAGSIQELLGMWGHVGRLIFAPVTMVLAGIIASCWVGWWIRRRPRFAVSDWYVFVAVLGFVSMGIALPLLALGDQARWHLQYMPLIVAVVLMLDTTAWRSLAQRGSSEDKVKNRSVVTRGCGWALGCLLCVGPVSGLLLTNGVVAAGDLPEWSRSRQAGFFAAPDSRASGSLEIAEIIEEAVREKDRAMGQGENRSPFRVAFMVHEHRGFHTGTVEWELERLGVKNVVLDRVGFINRPIDLDWFLRSDLIVTSSYEQLSSDGEAMRYQRVEEAIPELIGPGFTVFDAVQARYFRADVLRPVDWEVDWTKFVRVLDAARASDGRESMAGYYDLQALVWACRLGIDAEGDREEIVASAEVLAAEALPGIRRFVNIALDRLRQCEAARGRTKGSE